MLVASTSPAAKLNKRQRSLPAMKEALKSVDMPKLYIFNISKEEFSRDLGGVGRYKIPACKPGKDYSEPLAVDMLVASEYDVGDAVGTMAPLTDAGRGVAEDIVGVKSTVPGCELMTTNLEWRGVFISTSAKPSRQELEQARAKFLEFNRLVYATGAEKVQANEKVPMLDRKMYNDAAEVLGVKPLWGNQEAVLDRCVYCKEPIQAGAIKCKHCNSRLDTEEAKKLAAQA